MPFAIDGRIAHDEIEGGIWITDAQYAEALDGMLNGLVVKVVGGELRVEAVDAPDVDPVGDPTLGTLKMLRLEALSARRFEEETGGTFFAGLPIKTDRQTCSIITAAYVMAAGDPDYVVTNWKIADGMFINLDAATIIALANVVRGHIQSTFDQEAALSALVLAAPDKAALDAIDVW